MFKARYYAADGAEQGERDLPDWLFDGEVNEPVMHQVVTALRANQRQGTAAAKNRARVAGGSRKPWRQKGTGRARAGTTRAAQWVGGGRAFPPQPHSWRRGIPRKVKLLARHSAFNAQAQDGQVALVERFDDSAPKTGALVGVLNAMGVDGGRVLILTAGSKPNVYLSGRNVPGVEIRPFGEESAYDVLVAGTVFIEAEALEDAEPTSVTGGRRGGQKREGAEPTEDSEAIAEYEAKLEARKAMMAARAERALSRRVRGGAAPATAKAAAKPVKKKAAKKKAAPATTEAAEPAKASAAEAAPAKAEAAEAPKPKAEKKAPKAKPAAKAEPAAAQDAPLPKVSELRDHLAGLSDAAEVEALMARDGRKTAQAHYQRRLEELKEGAADD